MTNTTHAVPPAPPVIAPSPIMAAARANCAANLVARGYPDEAELFATGKRDGAFAMRHEVNRLRAERGEG